MGTDHPRVVIDIYIVGVQHKVNSGELVRRQVMPRSSLTMNEVADVNAMEDIAGEIDLVTTLGPFKVEKMMAKDVRDRIQTSEEVRCAIDAREKLLR